MNSGDELRFVESEICKVEKHLGICNSSGKNKFVVRTEHGAMTVRDTGYKMAGIPCAKLVEADATTAIPVKSAAA